MSKSLPWCCQLEMDNKCSVPRRERVALLQARGERTQRVRELHEPLARLLQDFDLVLGQSRHGRSNVTEKII